MQHLIFDFDGVIGDTWEAAIHAYMVYGSAQTREDAIAEMNAYFSKRHHHARNHTLDEEQLALEYKWASEFGAVMQQHGFSLFDAFVREIEAIDTPHKAVVSSGSQNYVLPALARTAINPTHILAFEDHHSKEEKIERICRDWHVEPNEVYYFTDTLADVYELRELLSPGKLIGVSWGFCSKAQLMTMLDEENILTTPADLSRVIII